MGRRAARPRRHQRRAGQSFDGARHRGAERWRIAVRVGHHSFRHQRRYRISASSTDSHRLPIAQTPNRMNLTSPSDSRVLNESVIETLQQGETLLAGISDETYTRKVPIAFNASIGGHYRHCLDHFRSLLDSAMDGDLNYDHRERDTLIEKDRFAALNATRELREGFERLDPIFLLRPLVVTCKTSYATTGLQVSPSTIRRGILYSVQ